MCGKEFYTEILVKNNNFNSDNQGRIKGFYSKNYGKIIARKEISSSNRYRTDIGFRLICKTRSGIQQALKSRPKSSSTKLIFGIDIITYRKWIELGLPEMTPELNWSNIEINHVKPICMCDMSKNDDSKHVFNWKNTQPLLKKSIIKRGLSLISQIIKYNSLKYINSSD